MQLPDNLDADVVELEAFVRERLTGLGRSIDAQELLPALRALQGLPLDTTRMKGAEASVRESNGRLELALAFALDAMVRRGELAPLDSGGGGGQVNYVRDYLASWSAADLGVTKQERQQAIGRLSGLKYPPRLRPTSKGLAVANQSPAPSLELRWAPAAHLLEEATVIDRLGHRVGAAVTARVAVEEVVRLGHTLLNAGAASGAANKEKQLFELLGANAFRRKHWPAAGCDHQAAWLAFTSARDHGNEVAHSGVVEDLRHHSLILGSLPRAVAATTRAIDSALTN